MPTDDERREVAARLRSLAGGYVTIGEIETALGLGASSPYVDLDRDARGLRRLADLIEPDCGTQEADSSPVPEHNADLSKMVDRDALLVMAGTLRLQSKEFHEIGLFTFASKLDAVSDLIREYCGEVEHAI